MCIQTTCDRPYTVLWPYHGTMMVSDQGTSNFNIFHSSQPHDLSFSSFACRWSCHASWCSDRRPDHKGDDQSGASCDEVQIY